jgi:sRNA-binding carbon storage regulator CsrA
MPLKLQRKIGMRFFIGNDIEIRLVGRTGNWVDILINAPGHEVKRLGKEQDLRDVSENYAHQKQRRDERAARVPALRDCHLAVERCKAKGHCEGHS